MDLFSSKGMGCLALCALLVGFGITCPMLVDTHPDVVLFTTKTVTVAPGASFWVSAHTLTLEKKLGKAAYAFTPGGIHGGPAWAFEGSGLFGSRGDGVVVGGNSLGIRCLAPSTPGTYVLTGKFPGLFSSSLRCTVTVAGSGGVEGPALGLVTPTLQGENLVWSFAASPVRPDCSATLLADGSVLVAGGWEKQGDRLASNEAFRYWPATRKVQGVGPMYYGRARHDAVRLKDGRILLWGGYGLRDGEVFDPADNSFRPVAAITGDGLGAHVCVLSDGQVLGVPFARSGAEVGHAVPSAFLLDGRTLALRATIPVQHLRESLTLTPLPDGGALVFGVPWDPNDLTRFQAPDPAAMAERFDASARTFWAGLRPRWGRREHQAVPFPDGRVLILGGWANRYEIPGSGGFNPVGMAEWYDPATGEFSEAETFAFLNAMPAVALKDGSLLYGSAGHLLRGWMGRARVGEGLASKNSMPPERIVPLPDGHALLLSTAAFDTRILYP